MKYNIKISGANSVSNDWVGSKEGHYDDIVREVTRSQAGKRGFDMDTREGMILCIPPRIMADSVVTITECEEL
jgi:hypothetical protein